MTEEKVKGKIRKKKVPLRVSLNTFTKAIRDHLDPERDTGLDENEWVECVVSISFPFGVSGKDITKILQIMDKLRTVWLDVNSAQMTPYDTDL